MRIRNTSLLFMGLSTGMAFSSVTLADVQVTMQEEQDGQSVIKLNRDWARITSQGMSGNYMLVDMNKQTSYMVDAEQKMVVKLEGMGGMMPPMMQDHGGMKKPEVSITEAGKGPKVAGFNTKRYLLKIEGQLCSEHFISREPLNIPEIKSFSNVMEKQAELELGMPGSACEFAENEFDKRAFEYGVPLLSKDATGNETFRITEINTRARFSANEFATPKGYKVVSQRELMEREMKRAMRNMPSEEEMERMGGQVQQQLQQFQDMFQPRAEN